MNKLNYISNMGLKITWKLIYIGINQFGDLTYDEVVEYLYENIEKNPDNIDDIVKIICEENDSEKGYKLIKSYAIHECSDMNIQAQKWIVYKLKSILENLYSDHLQGILQLIDFWNEHQKTTSCPIEFPTTGVDLQQYFSKNTYDKVICQSKDWLNRTLREIIDREKTSVLNLII